MSNAQPYISLVVTARNDDHGGNLLGRMQIFVNGWISQARRHNLPSELIIVEWNPPPDRPRLREVLCWPEDFGPCQVRFIEVPAELHRRYKHADALPLYQMIAKNVGIRRARGEFILATNIDILFSNELVAFFSQRRLEPGHIFRVDRYDTMSDVPAHAGIDEQLEYCRTHLIRINSRLGTFPLTPEAQRGQGAFLADFSGPSPIARATTLWSQLQGVIDRIARGGPLVPVTLPVPRFIKRLAAFYVEWGGLTGMLPNGIICLLRKLHSRRGAGCGKDIFEGDSRLLAGAGWYPLERYRGENFRWAQNNAEIVLPPSEGDSATLLLEVEPSRAVRRNPPDLCVLGTDDAPVARQKVRKLDLLRIPLQRRPGRTEVFTIAASRDCPNVPIFRVFRCALESPLPIGANTPPLLVRASGANSKAFTFDERIEMIVTAPDIVPAPLYLKVALLKEPSAQLVVTDSHGAIAGAFEIIGNRVLRLELPLRSGRTSVFNLQCRASGGAVISAWAWERSNLETRAPAPSSDDDQPLLQPVPENTGLLHTNACGDFTLAARQHWLDFRGYPEFDLYSMNIDSVFCYVAHHSGVREEILQDPMRIYHIEHATGSGWTPEGQAQLFARLADKGVGHIPFSELMGWAEQMRRLKCTMIFNHEDWGLANFDLVETEPAPDAAHASAERA